MPDSLLIPTPTSQNTVHPFTTPDTSGESTPKFTFPCRHCGQGIERHPDGYCPTDPSLPGYEPEAGISPEGRAALALAHQEQDAREGLCDYPAPFTCADCGVQAVEMRLYSSEIAWLCTACSGDDPDPPAAPARPQPDLSDPPRCSWCCCQPGIGILECVDCTSNYDAPTLHPSTEGLLCSACAAEAARCERCHSLIRPLVERVDSEGEVALYCEGGCGDDPTETRPEDLPGYNPPGDALDDVVDPRDDPDTERCRCCGCTETDPCDGGCWWVEEAEAPPSIPTRFYAPPALWEILLSEPGGGMLVPLEVLPSAAPTLPAVRLQLSPALPVSCPPDDPDPHPALRPLSGQESVNLYRAAAAVGRLPEVLAAAERPARLRELYSVLCGGVS